MVWIHGGGNTIGSATVYRTHRLGGGQRLVVATRNYWLGLFGWFGHPALRNTALSARDASGGLRNTGPTCSRPDPGRWSSR
ncbi:MAG: carboxylesterase family protein [Gammaproteobacteria bacterium]|nr:carboxylesterase family protein [Gammaproteobacteria bacterium]